jgi:uncharacterized protein (DUF362 family)
MIVENAQCEPKKGQAQRGHAKATRSTVARAQRPSVIDAETGTVNLGQLRELLGKAVCAAMGTDQPVAGFRRLFHPTDVVGIKVNTLAGKGLSTHPELVQLLAEWLVQSGVPSNQIVVWDRSDRELEAAGFQLNRETSGVRCQGTNDDYDWTPREWGANGSCFARLLCSELTALINVGLVKDHDLSGISAGMKNLYGVIHNPNKYHDNGCSPYLAQLSASPLIRDKLRLTILDGLIAQCHGGPARSPRWAWPWGGVLVSTDPVAIDAVAHHIIEERRRQVSLQSLAEEGREPKWLEVAAELGLGEARLERITVVDA